jgi:F-type H+-transporting ATPase subunit gamma
MANSRELKKSIKTISSTKKITRTMEMVATAKSKKAYDRIHALAPYASKLKELMGDLSTGGSIEHDLMRSPETVKHLTFVVITSNRGLCAGFNANLLRGFVKNYRKAKEEGKEIKLVVIGKKGLSFFKFAGITVDEGITDLDEKVTYARCEEIINGLIESFVSEKTDRVEVFTNKIKSSATTEMAHEVLLPMEMESIETEEGAASGFAADYIFNPDPATILQSLLPLAVKTSFFRYVIDSMAAELIARRLAMKNATDAATDMVRDLSRVYNRTRQAAITQEIAEIVGGVEAMK